MPPWHQGETVNYAEHQTLEISAKSPLAKTIGSPTAVDSA